MLRAGPVVSRNRRRWFVFVQIISSQRPTIRGGSGRLELAHWIVSPQNPLTARVLVNRLWQHHFGRGLVVTSDNFGTRGERPSHLELLDHLVAELMTNGWSLKHIQRQIVISSTYQQSGQGPIPSESSPDEGQKRRHLDQVDPTTNGSLIFRADD